MARTRIKVALAATTALLVAGTAVSQETEGGIRLTFGVSSDFRAHDNLDLDPVSAGPTVRSDTRLTFGLESETRRQSIALTFGGTVRVEEAPGTGFSSGFENPSARLSYALDGANAAFAFNASYARSDVDGFALVEDDEVPGTFDLIADDGFRDTYRLGATLETGKDAPLGFIFDISHQGTTYSGTSDPGLFDRMTTSASATARLRFSPVTEGRATASLSRYEAEDATSTVRDTRSVNLSLTHELANETVFQGSVGIREIDSSVTGVEQSGELSLSVSRPLPRGSIGASFTSELTAAGQQNRLQLDRGFRFPTGALNLSLGVVDGDGVNPQPYGSVQVSYEMPRAEVTASLSRGVSVSDDADIQRTTTGALGLSYEITDVSLVSFNVSYTDIDDAGGGTVTERERGSLRAAYSHELPEDWRLTAGYELRYLNEAGTGSAWDNAVFVTINRDFTFFP